MRNQYDGIFCCWRVLRNTLLGFGNVTTSRFIAVNEVLGSDCDFHFDAVVPVPDLASDYVMGFV